MTRLSLKTLGLAAIAVATLFFSMLPVVANAETRHSAAITPLHVLAQGGPITFTSVSHNFGTVASGSDATYGVKMTNGSGSEFPFSLTLTGASSFTYQDNCGSGVAAGASCEIVFTFTPSGTGTVTAKWSLSANGFTFSPSDGGTLTGSEPSSFGLTLSTAGHDFGTQGVMVPSGVYGVVLSNTTADAVTLTIGTVSPQAADFPVAGDSCGISLAANASCNLQWQFDPQAAQGYSAFYGIVGIDSLTLQPLVLTTSGGLQVSGVSLDGVGINPGGVALTSATNKFAEQGVNTISPPYLTELTNGTASAITLAYSGANANYVSTGDTCGAGLAAWQSCDIRWVFKPQAPGYAELDYGITASSGGNPVVITSHGQSVAGVTLSGTGILGTVSLATAAKDFGPWVTGTTSGNYMTTLSNSTPEAVNLKYAYSNSNSTQYNLTGDTCGATLLSGASCNLQWDFSPATTGPIGTTYDISGKGPCVTCEPISITSGTATVPGVLLTGNGQASAGLSLSTADHQFGEQGVGGSSATYEAILYNTTGAAVNLTVGYSSPTEGANFKIVGNNCTATMAANTSCNVQWQFMPETGGPISVVYNITATQGGSPVTLTSGGSPVNGVTLSGTGVQ